MTDCPVQSTSQITYLDYLKFSLRSVDNANKLRTYLKHASARFHADLFVDVYIYAIGCRCRPCNRHWWLSGWTGGARRGIESHCWRWGLREAVCASFLVLSFVPVVKMPPDTGKLYGKGREVTQKWPFSTRDNSGIPISSFITLKIIIY